MNQNYIVKRIFRKYIGFSVMSMIAGPLGMTVDSMVIGSFLGKEAMAAVGLANPIYLLLSALSGVIASGSISLCGQFIGREQPGKVKGIFSTAMLSAVILQLVCMVVFFCIPEQFAYLMGARDALLPLTADYIRGLAPGIGLSVAHMALVEFTKLDGSPALGPISIAAMAVSNVGMDLVNVFWMKQGIFGIALATSVSYAVGIAICCIHFFRPINTLKLVKIPNFICDVILLAKNGLPSAGNGICFAITIALTNYQLVFLGGSEALAAFSIQSSVALLLGALCLAAGSTTLLMSGIFYGEEDKKTLESAVKIAVREGFLIVLAAGVLCFVFINPIIALFGQANSAVAPLAFAAVTWKLLGLLCFTVNHVFVNYYQGTDRLFLANMTAIIEALPAQAIYIIVLPIFIGLNGIWLAPLLGGLTTFLLLTIIVTRHNGRFPRSIKDYLMFPSSFGVQDSQVLNFTIANDMHEVIGVSQKVQTFCKEQGIDAKRAHHLSLCVEEMAGNVVQYAFANKKKHFMDIRVLCKGDQLIFRLRDDGMPFNPLNRPLGADADLGKNIGIHLVKKLSRSIDYRYTVGLNNLLIKL